MSFTRFIATALRIRAAFNHKKLRFFVLKYMQLYPWSARWLDFVETLYKRHLGIEPPMEMVRTKFLRTYYSRRLSPRQRLAYLTEHYSLEAAILKPEIMNSLMRGEALLLARIKDKMGNVYSFSLCRHDRYRAEGELTIFLRAVDQYQNEDPNALAALTFHLGRAAGGAVIARIGGLQGPAGEDAKKRIINTTRALYGFRPKSAVLHVLRAFSPLLGVTALVAVADADHPLRNDRHAFVAHNDSFWLENDGCRNEDQRDTSRFVLPLCRIAQRTVEDIPPKKRKEWQARRALKDALDIQIGFQVTRWCLEEGLLFLSPLVA